jgi:hypothetical protein
MTGYAKEQAAKMGLMPTLIESDIEKSEFFKLIDHFERNCSN